jgi:hypothetical protein
MLKWETSSIPRSIHGKRLGFGNNLISVFKKWLPKKHSEYWAATPGTRQTKLFNEGSL